VARVLKVDKYETVTSNNKPYFTEGGGDLPEPKERGGGEEVKNRSHLDSQ